MKHHLIVSTVRQIVATIEASGGKPPKAAVADLERLTSTIDKVRSLDITSRLPEAVIDALEAGNDPATDPGVLAALARRSLATCVNGLDNELDLRAARFLDEHAEELVEAMRGPFEQAVATITAAAEQLGDIDLDDTAAAVALGGNAARVWVDARSAQEVIDRIDAARKVIGQGARSVRVEPQFQLLAIADVPAGEFIDERLRNSSMKAWDVVRRGWSLSLATPAVLAQRVQAVQDERQRRQQAPAKDFASGFRKQHGSPVAIG